MIFTNLKKGQIEKLKEFGEARKEKAERICSGEICILDPLAEKTLAPGEAGNFDYFVFGGLLGDFEIDAKTKKLLKFRAERRNLGKKEMPTDTAILAVKMIVDGIPLERIKFKDGLDIELKDGESMFLDYRYIVKDGRPSISDDLIRYLRKREYF